MANILWQNSYSSHWRLMSVNPTTWENRSEIAGALSMSISKDCTDSVPLLESGSLQYVTSAVPGTFGEGYYRVELIVTQGDTRMTVPIATMLCSGFKGTVDRKSTTMDISCYSVLKPAQQFKFKLGSFIPKGVNGAQWVSDKLREAGVKAPVKISGSFKLNEYYVFPEGMSYLEGIWLILDKVNWCMTIAGDGTITLMAKPNQPYLKISNANKDLLMTEIRYDGDITEVPNRYYVVAQNGSVASVTNNNSSSATSYSKRGRYIDYVDTSPAPVNGETLSMYAKRRLKEVSEITKQYSYKREYYPNLTPFRIINFDIPGEGISGDCRILKQSLTLGKGITVSETVGTVISYF